MNTHNLVCDFGRHRGTLYTRLPISYLKWMMNELKGNRAEIAKAELKRRGTVTPTIDISGHAIDRASQVCLDIWQRETCDGKFKGIHSWLVEICEYVLEENNGCSETGKLEYKELILVFEPGIEWPILKTVIRTKNALA